MTDVENLASVDPGRLVAALEAAGWVRVGQQPARYVRLASPVGGGQVVVPLNPAMADYGWRLDEIVTGLRRDAERGARARPVLDAIAATAGGAPAGTTDLDGAMHSVYLHGKWRWLTQNMTTEEREAAADAVQRYSRVLNAIDDEEPISDEHLRWWRS